MPSYAPKPNPLKAALPDGARKVVDFLFPEDDPTAGYMPLPLGPAAAAVQGSEKAFLAAIKRPAPLTVEQILAAAQPARPEAPQSLLRALAPLSKGSLQKGIEVAPEVTKHLPDYLPEPYPLRADPAVQEFWHLLRKAPEGPDPLKILANEKVTGRPPSIPNIKAPEGLTFSQRPVNYKPIAKNAPVMKRDPLVEEMTNRYRTFDNVQSRSRLRRK